MELNVTALRKAIRAYKEAPGGTEDGVVAAIKTYLTADLIKPDKGMILEPLDATPQRDYRKELWIGVATAVANGLNAVRNGVAFDRANEALAAFDKIFPKEHNHG